MGLFSGKKGMIFGLANKNSIAWGITQALHREGAELGFSYAGEILKKRVEPLAASINCDFVVECDVTNDAAIDAVFAQDRRALWHHRLPGAFDRLCAQRAAGRPLCRQLSATASALRSISAATA